MDLKYQNLSNILLLSSEFLPGPGGIGSHAFHVASALQKRERNIVVCTISDYASEDEEKAFDRRCSFNVFRFKRFGNLLFTWLHRIKVIHNYCIKTQITHVLSSGRFPIWTIPFLKLKGIPNVIAILHGSEVGRGFWSKLLFFCLNRADYIITVSKFTRSLLPRRIRNKTTVIHNGVDPGQWYPEKDKPGLNNYPILLTVGSISLRKGQYNVVSALPSIKKSFPDAHYHCVGVAKQKDILLDRIRELGVEKMVTIHGVVSHTTLENMYNKAHVNMMLTGHDLDGEVEGYGISVLEGNIFGIPTIGAKHSGLAESIYPGVNGLLVDPKSPEEIVNALRGISSDYKKYSHRSRQYALHNTWVHRIPHYEKYLV